MVPDLIWALAFFLSPRNLTPRNLRPNKFSPFIKSPYNGFCAGPKFLGDQKSEGPK